MTGKIVIIGDLSLGVRYLFKRYNTFWINPVDCRWSDPTKRSKCDQQKAKAELIPKRLLLRLLYINSLYWGRVIPLHNWNGTNKWHFTSGASASAGGAASGGAAAASAAASASAASAAAGSGALAFNEIRGGEEGETPFLGKVHQHPTSIYGYSKGEIQQNPTVK